MFVEEDSMVEDMKSLWNRARKSSLSMIESQAAKDVYELTSLSEELSVEVLSIALVRAVLYWATISYVEFQHGRKVPESAWRRFNEVLRETGEKIFGDRFASWWTDSYKEIHSAETEQKIRFNADREYEIFRHRVCDFCFAWAVRTFNSGIDLGVKIRFPLPYAQLIRMFKDFCSDESKLMKFDAVVLTDTFDEIDWEKLPNVARPYDVFISYRRSDGLPYAMLMKRELSAFGFRCFLDIDSIVDGKFDAQIASAIKTTRNFLFISTAQSLERVCERHNNVRRELETAIRFGRKVIIVVPDGTSKSLREVLLPASLEVLRPLQVTEISLDNHFDECVKKLIKDRFVRESFRRRFVRYMRRILGVQS